MLIALSVALATAQGHLPGAALLDAPEAQALCSAPILALTAFSRVPT